MDDAVRLPRDAEMIGIVVDRGHVNVISDIIRLSKNADLHALLSEFRRQDRFNYVVIAGRPNGGGVVGGLADGRDKALALFRLATDRLNEIAAAGRSSFSSAWMIYADEATKAELLSVAATIQRTDGSA